MAELEVASFLSIRSVYRQCELDCFLNFLFISGLFDMSFVVKNKTLCFRINSLVKFDENHTALVHVVITDVEDLVTVQISSWRLNIVAKILANLWKLLQKNKENNKIRHSHSCLPYHRFFLIVFFLIQRLKALISSPSYA